MRVLVATALVVGALVAVASTSGASGGGQDTAAAQSESCVPRASNSKGHRTTHPAARRVVERYARRTLERCDGVEGMGVGAQTPDDRPPRSDEKVHHITIYLRDRASRPPRTRSIAGVRIVYSITGPITPQ